MRTSPAPLDGTTRSAGCLRCHYVFQHTGRHFDVTPRKKFECCTCACMWARALTQAGLVLLNKQLLEVKPEEKMPRLSEEDAAEWKAATKQYNKLKLYETRLWQLDLSTKLQLKKAALAALPGVLCINTQYNLLQGQHLWHAGGQVKVAVQRNVAKRPNGSVRLM